MKALIFFLLIIVGVATATQLQAAPTSESAAEERVLQPLHFRYYGLYSYREQSDQFRRTWFLSTGVSWNPELHLHRVLALVPDLGAGVAKGNRFTQFFLVLDYRLMLSLRPVEHVFVELGYGGQTWTGHGTYNAYAVQAGYLFGTKNFLEVVDRFWIGLTKVSLRNGASAWLLKAGIGFEF